MQQTASSKQQRTPEEEHPQSGAAHSEEGLGQEALGEERYLYDASPSGGFLGVAFEWFVREPAGVVVALVWVVVLAWLSLLVLTLYMFGTSLASTMAAGV